MAFVLFTLLCLGGPLGNRVREESLLVKLGFSKENMLSGPVRSCGGALCELRVTLRRRS